MRKTYIVTLSSEERADLEKLANSGRTSARRQIHARILLKADTSTAGPGWLDAQISEALEISVASVARVRKRFVEEGLEAASTDGLRASLHAVFSMASRRPTCWL